MKTHTQIMQNEIKSLKKSNQIKKWESKLKQMPSAAKTPVPQKEK